MEPSRCPLNWSAGALVLRWLVFERSPMSYIGGWGCGIGAVRSPDQEIDFDFVSCSCRACERAGEAKLRERVRDVPPQRWALGCQDFLLRPWCCCSLRASFCCYFLVFYTFLAKFFTLRVSFCCYFLVFIFSAKIFSPYALLFAVISWCFIF